MWNVKTQVTRVTAGKTGILSKSSKKNSVKRTGKALHQEIQKTVILGIVHVVRKVLNFLN